MREINFYKNNSGKSPVIEFLNSITGKQAQKITWVLDIIESSHIVPKQYFKKLVNTDDIWEIRIGFFDGNNLIILTNGFLKKSKKTPKHEIKMAERRKKDYLNRRQKL